MSQDAASTANKRANMFHGQGPYTLMSLSKLPPKEVIQRYTLQHREEWASCYHQSYVPEVAVRLEQTYE